MTFAKISLYCILVSSASDKARLFAKNVSVNSNLDDSGISLPVFPSRTNLKVHNISVTPKMGRKVIMNLDLSKASGPGCISVVGKVFEKLVNNMIVDHLEKCGLFSDF